MGVSVNDQPPRWVHLTLAISGITTSVAIILFASSLGRWVDRAPSRLRTLVTTVSVNRIVVIAACVCWAVIITEKEQEDIPTSIDSGTVSSSARQLKLHRWKDAIFILILVLGILERLSRLANLISIERDWVPTMAAAGTPNTEKPSYDLSDLNAVMSRIDLICKLGSPIAISAFMSATNSPRLGAVLLIGLNFLTWPFEYLTAKQLWQGNESLQEEKVVDHFQPNVAAGRLINGADSTLDNLLRACKTVLSWVCQYGRSLQQYFETEVWMPSLAISSLHFSVLAFSSTLIVFLVNSGFSMTLITCAEMLSAIFELSSTFVFPWAVRALEYERSLYQPLSENMRTDMPTPPSRSTFNMEEDLDSNENGPSTASQITGVSRLGLLSITLTLITLTPAVPVIWQISTSWSTNPTSSTAWEAHAILTILLIISISSSRLGRFTSSLCTQQLAQSCVRPSSRSMFAGTEASLASTFGLAHYIATAIWNTHEHFRWVALSSVLVVAGGVGLYTFWLQAGRLIGR